VIKVVSLNKNIEVSKILEQWKELFELEGDKINAGICFGLSTAFKLGVYVQSHSIVNLVDLCEKKSCKNVNQRYQTQCNYDANLIIKLIKSNKLINK